jgi:cyclopropane-fatty-acyl-phospholipid synthase
MLLAEVARRAIAWGRLTIIDADGRRHVAGGDDGPAVAIRLGDRRLHRRLALYPHLYFGEAYMDGTLLMEEGTLVDLLQILFAGQGRLRETLLGRVAYRLARLARVLHQLNPITVARRNAAHHYDLGDELYELFLDREWQYSCAYFTEPHDDLERAQRDKMRHIAAKLLIEPGHKVLDIGSGWGSLAVHLARSAGCEVLGVTLAERQLEASRARARAAGLEDRVRFELRDYREVEGRFDRIVSVGMFEHVGVVNYPAFFRRIDRLLTEDGVALLHSIGRINGPDITSPWIRKHIFPGGYVPALSEVLPPVERQRLWVTDLEVLRLHYAETLRLWHRRFQANRERVKAIYDERFCRMWEFYLQASEAAFRRGDLMVFQMQLAKRRDAVPLTRDYITDHHRGGQQALAAE